ncbi:MAG TPA: hypothetical protein VGI60_15080 [Chthoniobacterales bacterium]|jgi:hypothetical protein
MQRLLLYRGVRCRPLTLVLALTLSILCCTRLAPASEKGWEIYSKAQQHIIVIAGGGVPKRPVLIRRKISNGAWELKLLRLDDFPKAKIKSETPVAGQIIEPNSYQAYIDGILAGIRESKNHHIFFFIHGGMNSTSGAALRAARLLSDDESGGSDFDLSNTGYPIFICWDSYFTGYFEQVTWVRAGHSERYGQSTGHSLYALTTMPFHLLADVGRGFTRFPAELSEFVHNDVYSIDPYPYSEFVAMQNEIRYLKSHPEVGLHISDTPTIPETLQRKAENVQTGLLYPIRTLSLPVIDSIGVGAWENMLRHVDTMFDRADTGTRRHPTPVEQTVVNDQTGALAIFFSRLQADADLGNRPIILVGHSMGAIVGNRIVSAYPRLHFSRIVYMGAACSFRDFQAQVIPYMIYHHETKFFNLSLHPLCEAGEVALSPQHLKLDIAPRGSLLVWLDNIFTGPPSEDERRLGIFQSTILASHNFPEKVRPQITLKCFDFNGNEPNPPLIWHPQHHADFADGPFWNPDYWRL